MKHTLALFLAAVAAAHAAMPEKLTDFELTDQHEKAITYRFPKDKISVVTVADHKGSDQLAPWIQRLYDRYQKRIDIDGVADVSMIPKPFHGLFRKSFKKQLTYSVMLDWGGDVVKQFAPEKGVANIYLLDRRGRVVAKATGPVNDLTLQKLTREIDRTIATTSTP